MAKRGRKKVAAMHMGKKHHDRKRHGGKHHSKKTITKA